MKRTANNRLGMPDTVQQPKLEPISIGILDTCMVTGLGERTVRRLLADGKLRAVKSGEKTLVLMESVREYVSSLPAAVYRKEAA
jgi:excisionase family DNA binding protein